MTAGSKDITGACRTSGTTWPRRLVLTVLGALVLGSFTGPAMAADAAPARDLVEVVVTRTAGSAGAAERAVVAAGGHVLRRFDVVDGFSAVIPSTRVAPLSAATGILDVAPNRGIELSGRRMSGDAVHGASSFDHVRHAVGAELPNFLGINGSRVGVALLDTGVKHVAGLDDSRVLDGPDLSSEAARPGTRAVDTYGHGTHMAGIIAGHDRRPSARVDVQGIAADATLVSVKAAGADGRTDLLTVLAGLDWIAQYKDTVGIRVVNLSFGAPDAGDYRSDPLAVAVERLWRAGLVVVVAGGNDGERAGSPLSSPGTDPFVIAVGAVDTKGTDAIADDVVESFSPTGTDARRVDVVAPGQSILSLRNPGSTADTDYPSARVGERLFKGTGTSQAAAAVSGVVADLLEARPTLTPDQVKAVLRSSATPLRGTSPTRQGAGMVNLTRALLTPVPRNATQTFSPAALPAAPAPSSPPPPPCPPSQPAARVSDADAASPGPEVVLADAEPTDELVEGAPAAIATDDPADAPDDKTAEKAAKRAERSARKTKKKTEAGTAAGGSSAAEPTMSSCDPAPTGGSWTGGSWTGGSWTGGSWTGGSWTGGSWTNADGTWTGGSWTGGSWTGGSWTGAGWTGGSWTGGSWTAAGWTGGSWTGGSWTGGSWTGGSWTGGSWTGGSWTGGSWTGGSWTGGSWTGGSWTGGSWTGGSWTGGSWTGGSWTGGSWTGGSWTSDAWAGRSWS